jgi:hypothetical protein
MPVSARAASIPLPKGWPGRIQSAVIHAISLTHFSLTFARIVAANNRPHMSDTCPLKF